MGSVAGDYPWEEEEEEEKEEEEEGQSHAPLGVGLSWKLCQNLPQGWWMVVPPPQEKGAKGVMLGVSGCPPPHPLSRGMWSNRDGRGTAGWGNSTLGLTTAGGDGPGGPACPSAS